MRKAPRLRRASRTVSARMWVATRLPTIIRLKASVMRQAQYGSVGQEQARLKIASRLPSHPSRVGRGSMPSLDEVPRSAASSATPWKSARGV